MNDILSRIVVKSTVNREELEDRKRKGFNKIEIQLFEKDLLTDQTTESSIQIIKDAITDLKLDIVSIHAPLSAEHWYHLIEYISIANFKPIANKQARAVFENTLKLTEEISKFRGNLTNLVVHTNLSKYQISDIYEDELLEHMKYLVYRYPKVRYSIENVTPINDNRCFVQGSYYENVYLCKLLQSKIDKEHFATTLDTCHALTTCRIVDMFKNMKCGFEDTNIINYKEFFRQNSDACNNVHMSSVEQFGFRYGQHGVKFEKGDDELIQSLAYIEEYIDEDALVTLEIREKKLEDYLDTKELPEYYNIIKETIGNRV
jgi:hypothetical protein